MRTSRLVLLARTVLYNIKIKLYKAAQTVVRHIDLKSYNQRFALSSKPITKVGINFDSTIGNITDWVIE